MKKRFTFLAALLLLSFLGTARSGPELTSDERKKVIIIAKQELRRRNITLPRRYEITALNMEMVTEVAPARPLYEVNFHCVYRGKKQLIYTVVIDKRSLKVTLFSDDKATIPIEF
jgi:hypothetical protein